MSADSLDRAFGIAGYRVTRSGWEDGVLVFRVERPRQTLRCAACGARDVHRKGAVVRTLKTLPVGGRPVQLRQEVPRVRCRNCGLERQVPLALAEPKKTFT